jgi:uncharacterized protein with ParB-like and HNH nuclease domain
MENNNKFNTEVYTLEKLADRRFVIPSYQRPYVWGEEQINKFLSDFYDVRNKDKYYVGTVLLYEQKIGDKVLYQLIDGQQRFTTLWLVASAFKMLDSQSQITNFLKVGDELRLDFAIRKQIKAYLLSLLEKKITDKNQYSDAEIENDEYLTHIAQAITTIVSYLQQIIDKNDLNDFGNFIYTKVHFVVNTVPDNSEKILNKLFATINNTGVQLEQSDILKSLLLKNMTTERTLYSRVWEACENMNNYFERNVKQLFTKEFDWANINYEGLKDLKDFNLTNSDGDTNQFDTNNLKTIAEILNPKIVTDKKIEVKNVSKVIENVSLTDIRHISGKLFGKWIGKIVDSDCSLLQKISNENMKIQLQLWDDRYIKGVEIELRQKDQNIELTANWAKYGEKEYSYLLGQDWNDNADKLKDVNIAKSEKEAGYGVYEITINPTDNTNTNKNQNNYDEDNAGIENCRSIIKFPQLLLHAYRIFLKRKEKEGETDFELPFHTKNLIQIFKPLTNKDEQTIKDFFKCLWEVRFIFDKDVVKWIQQEDDKDEILLLSSISKQDNSFTRTHKEKSNVSMLQSMLYFTGNYNTQIWLTPYLKRLLDGEDSLSCLEEIDNKLSLSEDTDKETSFALMDSNISDKFDFVKYLKENNGTSFRHYWFQKLEYILWKEFSGDATYSNDSKFKNYRITSKNSVEHVFPQHHETGKEIDKGILNSFGNLALLSVNQNSSYSNQDVDKKRIDFNNKPVYDSLKLKLIYDEENWNEDAIEKHRDAMIGEIKQHYRR